MNVVSSVGQVLVGLPLQFLLDHFDDYTKHFAAMNYREADELLHIHHTDFIQAFEKQYPNLQWKDIEMKIYKTLGGGVLGSHCLSTTSRSGRLRQVTRNVTRWICFWSGGKGGKAPLPIAL
ncbi:Tubulin--tyrosine ligase-like protein 12 [Echinococcus granulosus]|nr:Tubulin--tyrosine ligase-like protein 12 [Echinococcus granulosus]